MIAYSISTDLCASVSRSRCGPIANVTQLYLACLSAPITWHIVAVVTIAMKWSLVNNDSVSTDLSALISWRRSATCTCIAILDSAWLTAPIIVECVPVVTTLASHVPAITTDLLTIWEPIQSGGTNEARFNNAQCRASISNSLLVFVLTHLRWECFHRHILLQPLGSRLHRFKQRLCYLWVRQMLRQSWLSLFSKFLVPLEITIFYYK